MNGPFSNSPASDIASATSRNWCCTVAYTARTARGYGKQVDTRRPALPSCHCVDRLRDQGNVLDARNVAPAFAVARTNRFQLSVVVVRRQALQVLDTLSAGEQVKAMQSAGWIWQRNKVSPVRKSSN